MTETNQDIDLLARANRAVQAALGAGRLVQSVEDWGGGAHNSGYRLRLADGEQVFWKVERENIFPRARRGQVEREVAGIRLASAAGVDCPRVLGYDTSGTITGSRYILEAFIEGDLLGEVMPSLDETEQAALMYQFQAEASKLTGIHGDAFGEVAAGGPLGQHLTWPALMQAFSTILLEDAHTLACFSAEELALVREAHAAALARLRYSGPPTFVHLDLHIFNAFARRVNGAVAMGKLFDFGFCLFLAPYVIHYNQDAFGGQEARLAGEYGVSESELHAFHLVFALEITTFFTALRFAPDKPYGYVSRQKEYLAHCAAYLGRG